MGTPDLRKAIDRLGGGAHSSDPLASPGNHSLRQIASRLAVTMGRDHLVQNTLEEVRQAFQVDRVVLYYFFRQWRGQVTAEALSGDHYSILGSSGADECFNDDYAQKYLAGRIHAVEDLDAAAIAPCHLAFLQGMQVRANLVAPILTPKGLWGLIVAHHCRSPYPWREDHIRHIQQAAQGLAQAESIRSS